jgi:hypothetical protein
LILPSTGHLITRHPKIIQICPVLNGPLSSTVLYKINIFFYDQKGIGWQKSLVWFSNGVAMQKPDILNNLG